MEISKETIEKLEIHAPELLTPLAVLLTEIRMILSIKENEWRKEGYSEEEIERLSIEYLEKRFTKTFKRDEEA